MQVTTENVAEVVSHWQAGRGVTYREVPTEDLIVDAVRYFSAEARGELSRRGIDWTRYLSHPAEGTR